MSNLSNILAFLEGLLKDMLNLLESQHKAILKNDIESMENIAVSIEEKGKEIENIEKQRKEALKDEDIKEAALKDTVLDDKLRSIKKIIYEIDTQKSTNAVILKQGINFNNKIINILSQKKSPLVYNKKGELKR